jgi:hypothetical protein
MQAKNVQRCAMMLLLTGCAQHGVTYWIEKDSVVTVHHVTGGTDQTEKLVKKPFASDLLGDGQYYQVSLAAAKFVPPTHQPKTKQDKQSAAKITELTEEVESLKDKLRGKEELATTKATVPIDINNSVAADPAPIPKEPMQADDIPRQSL